MKVMSYVNDSIEYAKVDEIVAEVQALLALDNGEEAGLIRQHITNEYYKNYGISYLGETETGWTKYVPDEPMSKPCDFAAMKCILVMEGGCCYTIGYKTGALLSGCYKADPCTKNYMAYEGASCIEFSSDMKSVTEINIQYYAYPQDENGDALVLRGMMDVLKYYAAWMIATRLQWKRGYRNVTNTMVNEQKQNYEKAKVTAIGAINNKNIAQKTRNIAKTWFGITYIKTR